MQLYSKHPNKHPKSAGFWMLTVILIQIEHNLFWQQSYAKVLLTQNPADFGCLRGGNDESRATLGCPALVEGAVTYSPTFAVPSAR